MVQSYKMRANHNSVEENKEEIVLWCMVQSYKNESKSQHWAIRISFPFCCDVWYKVTKMRANHNIISQHLSRSTAVMYGTKLQKWEQITTRWAIRMGQQSLWCMVQSYKNESKSQLMSQRIFPNQAVMYGTKLQKWEQITTQVNPSSDYERCDVWYKVTKMRANHNLNKH